MSRCGSTLVAQMLAALPQAVVISEAAPIDEVIQAGREIPGLSLAEQAGWLRSIASVLGQPRNGEDLYFEAIRRWCLTFGSAYAPSLRRRQGRLSDTWYLDELSVDIQGRQQYLWRAVDQDGDVIDILVQPRRDRRAAERFFRKLFKGQDREPRCLITDKLHTYSAPQHCLPSVVHSTQQYENNRAEVSHQPTRQRERQMRLLRAVHHRVLRARSFLMWNNVTGVC